VLRFAALSARIRISPEVKTALAEARPVVVLESSVIAQGLPPEAALKAARAMDAAVRAGGAVPAMAAVVGGEWRLGLSPDEVERLADPTRTKEKVAARDLGAARARGVDAGTTVSATAALAAAAGLPVMATGGIGGVHRRHPHAAADVSSDLYELSRLPVAVVCAGAKAVLDLPQTFEAIEMLGIPVLGFRCEEFPAFFHNRSGLRLLHAAADAQYVAAMVRQYLAATDGAPHLRRGVIVAHPVPAAAALAAEVVESAIARALAQAAGARGAEVTPLLLRAVAEATGGASLRTNLAVLESNARAAAEIAGALAADPGPRSSSARQAAP
jgi:pseudouridine-5'-phosphate glycosidase